ncbi:hypothetical protein G6F40_017461 [Rhizopus arrhizus]|nr:hypothetical protein G6F40_017461 [Rhizopus arrhizus]
MGVLPVASGGIAFDGADITRLAPHQRAARGMAYVPQGRDIFARLTVEENILMGMATRPASRARRIKEEVFGPVCHVAPFDTEEEAIRLANDTRYGRAAAWAWPG